MSEQDRFTPGPWYSKMGMVYGEDGDTIATMGGNVEGAPTANAQLIAAAPAAVKAMREIVELSAFEHKGLTRAGLEAELVLIGATARAWLLRATGH